MVLAVSNQILFANYKKEEYIPLLIRIDTLMDISSNEKIQFYNHYLYRHYGRQPVGFCQPAGAGTCLAEPDSRLFILTDALRTEPPLRSLSDP